MKINFGGRAYGNFQKMFGHRKIWPRSFYALTASFRRFILAFVFVVAFYISLNYDLDDPDVTVHRHDPQNSPVYLDEDIHPGCECLDKETNILYNFCYNLPSNRSIRGRKFDCQLLPIIKSLSLLDFRLNDYFRFDRNALPAEPVFVTAASDSHFYESLSLISLIQKNFPSPPNGQRLIFYDIGLSVENIAQIRHLCQVEYRRFAFEKYPSYVGKLMDFRWKPILIAESLKEFGAIWYLDSSVRMEKGNISHVYELLNCRRKRNATDEYISSDPKFISSGFHVDSWMEAIRRCDKYAYLLQGFTGHGIFSATHPGVYEYIPTDIKRLKNPACKMYEAGFMFAVRTSEVVLEVLKWYVLCALEPNCMAPPGTSLGCSFNVVDRFGVYAHCHRYDQSVVNLLLANRNHYDSYYWTSGIVDYFHIVRGSGDSGVQYCAPVDQIVSQKPK